jgi:hypothetical protein
MEKIYCGSGKTRSGQYGEFYGISICLSDLPKEHITTAKNGKKYINLTVSKKKEADQYGKDLSVSVDTFKPEAKQAPAPSVSRSIIDDLKEDFLPF